MAGRKEVIQTVCPVSLPGLNPMVRLVPTMLTRILIATCGLAVMMIGTISLTGYVFRIYRLYGWLGDGQPMAFNTALAFFLVGVALSLVAGSHRLWKTDG